ncbi:MAG: hypothetical protein Alis3KO_28640 [Aliiglaciecola sp.]
MNKYLYLTLLFFVSFNTLATNPDPTIHYFVEGRVQAPWELSLEYGQRPIDEEGKASTVRNSLSLEAIENEAGTDVVKLTWKPKGIKNEWGAINESILTATMTNTQRWIDLSNIKDQAALAVDIRVIAPPKELVEWTLESEWNWQERASFPLKNVLKRLPKKKWVTIPIPLKCFDNSNLNFEKITSIMQLKTAGKMTIELGDIRLAAAPPNSSCG